MPVEDAFAGIYKSSDDFANALVNARAAAAYGAGNRGGAANLLARAGQWGTAEAINPNAPENQLRSAQMDNYRAEATARDLRAQQDFISTTAPKLQSIYQGAETQRPGSGGAALNQTFDQYLAPGLAQRGVKPDEIGRYKQMFQQSPQTALQVFGALAQKKVEWSVVGGELIGHTDDGQIVHRTRAGKIETIKQPDGSTTTGWLDPEAAAQPGSATVSVAGQAVGAPPPPPPEGPVPAAGGFDAFKSAIRGQEAPAGQAGVGVAGQPTAYGTAHGQMQVLDSTGEGTARKLGIAWRPDLMRGTSPEAAAYQDQIGTAVAQDAWQQAKGDPRTAAALYFAGPDHRLWGPKTRQYQQDIVNRMGAPAVPTERASASVPAPAGFTPLVHTAAPPPKPPAAPSGFQWGPDGKSLKPIPGGPADTQDEIASFSPAAIDVMADTYLSNGGKMPSVGMGKAGAAARILVMNRVAEKMAARGETVGGVNARGASLKADSTALSQMTKTKEMVNAAEDTALKAADFVVQGMAGGGGTRFPLINKAIIAGRRATGDPQADVYVNRLGTFVDEYSKVIGGGTGSAAPTDSVRKEAGRRISEASSPDQLRQVLDSMKQEMQFRSASLEDHVSQIQARISGKQAATQPSQAYPQQAQMNARFGRTRGWTNQMEAPQLQAFRALRASDYEKLGAGKTDRTPIPVLSADDYAKVQPGEYYLDSRGSVHQKGGR